MVMESLPGIRSLPHTVGRMEPMPDICHGFMMLRQPETDGPKSRTAYSKNKEENYNE